MLKVLHVIGPMATGGAQTQLLGLLRVAHGSLWNATVCATSPGAMTAEFRAAGIPVIELKRFGSPGLIRMARLRRLVSKGGFDVVHSNLWQSNLYSRLAVVGRFSRPVVVISERGLDDDRSRMKRWMDRRLRSVTDGFVGNSATVVDFITAAHGLRPGRVVLIPNGIDKTEFERREPGLRNRRPLRVGTVGRLNAEKGQEVLVEATRLLVEAGIDVEVHIAGNGPRRRELEALGSGLPVDFLGELRPGAEVAKFLWSLDVFVLPSHQEGRPNSVLEALAVGVATVVCDAPGSVEALDEGGTVVPRGSAKALAHAIQQVAGDLPRAEERARSAGDRVQSFDALATEYDKLFKSFLLGRP